MAMKQVIVPLQGGSDGDFTHRPNVPMYTMVHPPTLYLEKLATLWMQQRRENRPGVSYILEGLPTGYALYERPRPSNPKHIDKFLYGHHAHKPFNSPNQFFPHFLHLMEVGDSIGCTCAVCASGGIAKSGSGSFTKSSSNGGDTRNPTPAPSVSGFAFRPTTTPSVSQPAVPTQPYQPKGRPKMIGTGIDASRVDEEGTPDVYRNLIDKLKRHTTLDENIMQPMSLDWRAEQKLIPGRLEKLAKDPQWIPREGDIVLFVRIWATGLELVLHAATGQYEFYDPAQKAFLGVPTWEAGLVGEAPVEATEIEDIVHEGPKQMNVSYSGVRVEPLPNPNSTDKKLSKRSKYVPVHHTRPFFLWRDFLPQDEEDIWQPTIKNALTVMATVALMGTHRFRGQWPTAQIYAHGMYLGSETLAVGDTVRLLPKAGDPPASCSDIMVIKSIRLKLWNLDKASANDWDEGRPYNSQTWVFGTAYTTDASRSSKEWASDAETPKSAEGYGNWYPLHPLNKELGVPFWRVMGRLYEHDAMRLWLPSTTSPSVNHGSNALLEARAFATANDNRIQEAFDQRWYLANSRTEALDLQTVNGLEVGKYDMERDPKDWRKKIKIMEGHGNEQQRVDARLGATTAPGGARGLRNFLQPPGSMHVDLPVRNQERGLSESGSGSGTSSTTAGSSRSSRKRSRAIEVSDDDEEIRQQTRIIENDVRSPAKKKKKAKVLVVIESPASN